MTEPRAAESLPLEKPSEGGSGPLANEGGAPGTAAADANGGGDPQNSNAAAGGASSNAPSVKRGLQSLLERRKPLQKK